MTEDRFEAIYTAYFTRVYHYALRLCKNETEAEELTSDVFIKALGRIDSFRGECDIFSWLCSIAKNCYISKLRREKPRADAEELETVADSVSIADMLEDSDTAMRLHERLHTLDEPYKEVFSLRVFGELSFKQIAHLFGKTENWACVTYHRARAKLTEDQ